MNTEELKMVLDALTNLGTTGGNAFYFWLLADKVLPSIVTLVLVSTLIILVYRFLVKAFCSHRINAAQEAANLMQSYWLRTSRGKPSYDRAYALYRELEKLAKQIKEEQDV